MMGKANKAAVVVFLLGLSFFSVCRRGKPVPTIDQVPPPQLAAFLESNYRLKPDRRLSLARQELNDILGLPAGRMATTFKDGQWHLYLDGKKWGQLPEFPGFRDILDLLLIQVRTLNPHPPFNLESAGSAPDLSRLRQRLGKFFPRYLWELLKELDHWHSRKGMHPEMLQLAASALARLCLQSLDRLDLTDLLVSRALAFLALAKGLTPYDMNEEEAVIAYVMGYHDHCEEIVKKLPESNAFSLYFRGEDLQLETAAEADNNAFTRYLWLWRFAGKRNVADWQHLWQRYFKNEPAALISIIKTGFEMDKYYLNRRLSLSIPRIALTYLQEETKAGPETITENGLSACIRSFDKLIRRFEIEGDRSGLFYEPMITGDFLRGYFYSALYILGMQVVDRSASLKAATFYLEEVDNPGYFLTREWKSWFSHLLNSRRGREDVNLWLHYLKYPGRLRGELLNRSFAEAAGQLQQDSPLLAPAVRGLMTHLDSRWQHRIFLAEIVHHHLHDLNLLERILASMVFGSTTRPASVQVWYASLNNDQNRLLELFRRTDIDIAIRARILAHLSEFEGVTPIFIQYGFNQLVEEEPDNWSIRADFVNYLKQDGKFKMARRILRDWLEARGENPHYWRENMEAGRMLAGLLYLDRQYRQGLEIIEPFVECCEPGVERSMVLILSGVGDVNRAENWARKLVRRHPLCMDAHTLLAETYWNHGRYGPAAEVLKAFPLSCNPPSWGDKIAAAFLNSFERKTPSEVQEAFSVLIRKKIDNCLLLALPKKIYRAGNPRLAFQLQRLIKSTGWQRLLILITAYRYLSEWKDKATALEWLQQKVPRYLLPMAANAVYGMDEYELLWQWPIQLQSAENRRYKRLLQTAAILKMGGSTGDANPHWLSLKDYYSRQNIYYYDRLGGFLAGLIPQRDLYSWMNTPARRCEIAYFIGLKEEAMGHYDRAVRWYRISIETGNQNNAAYQWSFKTLRYWAGQNRFSRYLER